MNEFYTALLDRLDRDCVRLSEPMKEHTTFRVGGPADYYISVASIGELIDGLACCKEFEISAYVLGNGSNVLVSDEGIRGVVFQLDTDFSKMSLCQGENSEYLVTAQAGAMLGRLGAWIAKESLTGFEWAAGIPGTVGGAVYMNAGAYGGEMKDILTEVTVLTQDLQVEKRSLEQLRLGYRKSALMEEKAYVLDATFRLKKGNNEEIKAKMEELAGRRREKQPLEYPSAGSTFKRPEGYFAGKLIQDAGLCGYQVGGAQVSEKHCGFVINRNDATAQDIYQLTEDVSRIVQEKFGVRLEREIRLMGAFPC